MTTANMELRSIVESARTGDRAAFAQLVARVQDMAMAVCYGRLGNRDLARDAAQDAFVDAYLHLSQLSEAGAFMGWFRRVLLKHCDRRVRRKRPDTAQLEQHEEQMLERGPNDAEAALLGRERDSWLWDTVEALPEHERTPVALYYLADRPVTEIAALLELPSNTIKQRLHSARKRLRERSLATMSEQFASLKPSRDAAFSNHVALFLAIRSGDEAGVRALVTQDPALLEAREAWNTGDWPGRDLPVATRATPLIRAAETGNVPIVRMLLDAGALIDGDCGCPTAETALWAAVVTRQADAARELLLRGADPMAQTERGINCLHTAAMRGDSGLVELLLQHGADPSQPDREGRTAADWARLKGHDAVLAALGTGAVALRNPATEPMVCDAPALYATGIKALDLFAPLQEGSFVLVHGGAGVGRNILIAELADVARRREDTASVWVMWQREVWSDAELELLLNETQLREHVRVLRHAHDAHPATAREQPERALALAETLLAQGLRHVQLTFFERPGVRTAIEALIPALGQRSDGSAISAFVVPPWQLADETETSLKPPFDTHIGFDRELARSARFPALHAQTTRSRLLSDGRLSPLHVAHATEARALLATSAVPGQIPTGDPRLERAVRLQAYLTQPFAVAEPFSGRPGVSVALDDMLADVAAILNGDADHLSIDQLAYRGALDRVADAARGVVRDPAR